jgi:hypothetical protein
MSCVRVSFWISVTESVCNPFCNPKVRLNWLHLILASSGKPLKVGPFQVRQHSLLLLAHFAILPALPTVPSLA